MPHSVSDRYAADLPEGTALCWSCGRRESARVRQQALWLTEREAETLLSLCVTSSLPSGDEEEALLAKLGEHLRQF